MSHPPLPRAHPLADRTRPVGFIFGLAIVSVSSRNGSHCVRRECLLVARSSLWESSQQNFDLESNVTFL
jgi:hypothetical protein